MSIVVPMRISRALALAVGCACAGTAVVAATGADEAPAGLRPAAVLVKAAQPALRPPDDRQAANGTAATAPRGGAPGSIAGTVVYREDKRRSWRLARYYVRPKSGELAEAVVALSGPDLGRASAKDKPRVATVDQKDMRFLPETAAIRAGDRVRFTNSDPQTHNISLADPRLSFSDTIANGQAALQTFPRASGIRRPFALGCALHSQMQAWIYVFDHPFFQVTGEDGRFRLDNIPPGKYRLDVAHAAAGLNASRTVEIRPGETAAVEFVLTVDDRSRQLTERK